MRETCNRPSIYKVDMSRYLIILLVIALYLVPFYQKRSVAQPETVLKESPAAAHDRGADERPFYSEDLVTRQAPGTIAHVSSIAPAGNNRMACVWYAGSREGAADVSIYYAVYNEKDGTWTDPVVLVSREQASRELGRYIKKLGNPVIFSDKEGRLWLFYASVTVGGWSGTSLNYKTSTDEGLTWTKSRKMMLGPFFNLAANVKNKGVNMDDGSFLLPVYHEFMKKYSQALLVRPGDVGTSYEIRKMTRTGRAIQPSIVHEGGKKLTAFFRNMGPEEKRHVLTSTSDDLGLSWSGLKDTALPNPNSGLDMVRLDSSDWLAVINNSFEDRDNLTMMISGDNGKSWKTLKVLEQLRGNEYSYPSMSRSGQGLYHITYTYNRQGIKHIVFNEAWIRQNKEALN